MIAYIYSKEYVKFCDKHKKFKARASAVHELIRSYGLLNYLKIIEPKKASRCDLQVFHSLDYVDYIMKLNENEDLEKLEDESLEYGLGYDCRPMAGLSDYVLWVSGATLTAAKILVEKTCKIAINWGGGWHHAKKDEAQGFCYVNDIVLGILCLRSAFEKVLYIDIDLHHGDGVEEAFAFTSKVMTVSFHKYDCGFYPGTGSSRDVGFGKGRYRTVNVPLRDGIQDEQYFSVFKRLVGKVVGKFEPDAIVFQCGADTISGDPMDSFSLTPRGVGFCVKEILQFNLPTLFLGGGGYHTANTARCWTYLTGLILGLELPTDIPENEYFTMYGPSYELSVTRNNRPNRNEDSHIKQLIEEIEGGSWATWLRDVPLTSGMATVNVN